jgi:hypothetical protein
MGNYRNIDNSATDPPLSAQASFEELTAWLFAALERARIDRRNALRRDLDIGDALIAAQKHILSEVPSPLREAQWGAWLHVNFSLSERTAQLYMQLARHRAKVEAEIEQMGDLSLRAALRLISKPTGKPRAKTPDLITALNKATDTEITAALAHLGFEPFLRVMPPDWRLKFVVRIVGLRAGAGHPESKITAILRKALSLAKTTATPGISEPMADSNRNEALAALGQINILLACGGLDLNDIVINGARTTSRSRRGAA